MHFMTTLNLSLDMAALVILFSMSSDPLQIIICNWAVPTEQENGEDVDLLIGDVVVSTISGHAILVGQAPHCNQQLLVNIQVP